jgi:hypothetical protein
MPSVVGQRLSMRHRFELEKDADRALSQEPNTFGTGFSPCREIPASRKAGPVPQSGNPLALPAQNRVMIRA